MSDQCCQGVSQLNETSGSKQTQQLAGDVVGGLPSGSRGHPEGIPVSDGATPLIACDDPVAKINEWIARAPVVMPFRPLPSNTSRKHSSEAFRYFLSQFVDGNESGVISDGIRRLANYTGYRCVVDRTFFIPYFLEMRFSIILRPRGFGKSFWLFTLRTFFSTPHYFTKIFAVSKMCFRVGDRLWDPRKVGSDKGPPPFESTPILFFSFMDMESDSGEKLENALLRECKASACKPSIQVEVVEGDTWASLLERMIRERSNNLTERRIVVLIDNYDHNLVRAYGTVEFESLKSVHCEFFTLLHSMRDGILLQCVTGVSRWKISGMFDELKDVTLDPCVAQLLGFTQAEVWKIVESNCWLGDMNESRISKAIPSFRKNCGGFSFGDPSVAREVYAPYLVQAYAPYLLSYIQWADDSFNWYFDVPGFGKQSELYYQSPFVTTTEIALTSDWVEPQLVRKYLDMMKGRIPEIHLRASTLETAYLDSDMESNCAAIMFFMGYLTVKQCVDKGGDACYHLDFPNARVSSDFVRVYMRILDRPVPEHDLMKHLSAADFPQFFCSVNQFLGRIPQFVLDCTERGFTVELDSWVRFSKPPALPATDSKSGNGREPESCETAPDIQELGFDLKETEFAAEVDLAMEGPEAKIIVSLRRCKGDDTLSKFRRTAERAVYNVRLMDFCHRFGPGKQPAILPHVTGGSNKRLYMVGAAVTPTEWSMAMVVFESGKCMTFGEGARTRDKDSQAHSRAVGTLMENPCWSFPSRNEFYMTMFYGCIERVRMEVGGQVTAREVSSVFMRHGVNALSLMSMKDSDLIAMGFASDSGMMAIMASADFAKPVYRQLLEFRVIDCMEDIKQLVRDFVEDTAQQRLSIDALWDNGSLDSVTLGTRLVVESLKYEGFPGRLSARICGHKLPAHLLKRLSVVDGATATQPVEPPARRRRVDGFESVA